MDFGRINESELSKVDFALPADPLLNNTVLKGKPAAKPVFYMGCAKWGRPDWVGSLYPLKTKEKDFLDNYVHHYNSIELNATHYKNYGAETILKWAEKAGRKNFKFCPKMLNSVTHFGNLKGKEFLTGDFLKNIIEFKEHLGAIFVQFSESFSPKRKDELFEYLATLPQDLDFFIEVRHPDWFSKPDISNELFSTLQKLKLGAVITDTAGRRDCVHMHLTTPNTFIRFVGNSLHASDYSRIDEWAERIKCWKDNGLKELYFFMHMHDEAKSPELTVYLANKFNEVFDAGLEVPKLLPPVNGLFD